MTRACIVNVAFGDGYDRMQDRLVQSVRRVSPKVAVLTLDHEPPGCPPHAEAPYAFKHHMIRYAESRGYDLVVWADCSIVFIKPVEELMRLVWDRGYWISCQGGTIGEWCSDEALTLLGWEREEALKVTAVTAGLYGLDLRTPIGQAILRFLERHEAALPGPWAYSEEERPHPAVKGHRHDQPILSTCFAKHGLVIEQRPCWLDYLFAGQEEPIPNYVGAVVSPAR